jgi:hypothetical protein
VSNHAATFPEKLNFRDIFESDQVFYKNCYEHLEVKFLLALNFICRHEICKTGTYKKLCAKHYTGVGSEMYGVF